jgi:hypothetical protein
VSVVVVVVVVVGNDCNLEIRTLTRRRSTVGEVARDDDADREPLIDNGFGSTLPTTSIGVQV